MCCARSSVSRSLTSETIQRKINFQNKIILLCVGEKCTLHSTLTQTAGHSHTFPNDKGAGANKSFKLNFCHQIVFEISTEHLPPPCMQSKQSRDQQRSVLPPLP